MAKTSAEIEAIRAKLKKVDLSTKGVMKSLQGLRTDCKKMEKYRLTPDAEVDLCSMAELLGYSNSTL
ncbi:MAG: hypothetical protein L3J15_03350 [Devosiaceae bacterium]|nr:hypothetical protein [Devosiaceae bacterium]